jgi:hypothetical protein
VTANVVIFVTLYLSALVQRDLQSQTFELLTWKNISSVRVSLKASDMNPAPGCVRGSYIYAKLSKKTVKKYSNKGALAPQSVNLLQAVMDAMKVVR